MRLFYSVHLPTAVEERLGSLLLKLKAQTPVISWVRKENLHFTLRYLGEVNSLQLEDALEVGRQVGANITKGSIRLAGVGTFPERGTPKVIWLGIENSTILRELNQPLETLLVEKGFAAESKRYSPHLTMGRVKVLVSDTEMKNLLKTIEFTEPSLIPVEEFSLMESILTPMGPKYRVVESFKLRG